MARRVRRRQGPVVQLHHAATASTQTTRSGSTIRRSRSGYIRGYIEKLQAGESIDRPTAEVAAERDRITSEYRALLADDDTRAAFDEKLGLSRLVFPYVENHNFFVEHWALSVFWRRIRELGAGAAPTPGSGRTPTTSSTSAATSSSR